MENDGGLGNATAYNDYGNLQTQEKDLKVCHLHCVRSIIQSCSVYISIYTYSHEHNNITISSNI